MYSYTSDAGKNYDFNTADTLNTLLLNCMFASGQLKEGEMYDVDFDHQFIETEKYDAKRTRKKNVERRSCRFEVYVQRFRFFSVNCVFYSNKCVRPLQENLRNFATEIKKR